MRQAIIGRRWLGLFACVAILTTVAATLGAADAQADRSGGNHHARVTHAAGVHGGARSGWRDYAPWWFGGWGGSAAANVDAKAAARAAYDARDSEFLHRCYQPQRIWNGAYYTWRLVSVC